MKSSSELIKQILLTEKGTYLTESENKYQFRVSMNANKIEIKRAVEELFSVRVVAVNTMRRKGDDEVECTVDVSVDGLNFSIWENLKFTLEPIEVEE